jgi:predicted DNA-binding transcriptional regulator AlpA
MPDNAPITTLVVPLLTDAAGVGHLLGISRASVFNLQATGQLPAAVLRRGQIVRWAISDIQLWISLSCPSKEVFELHRGPRR